MTAGTSPKPHGGSRGPRTGLGVRVSRWLGTAAIVLFGVTMALVVFARYMYMTSTQQDPYGYGILGLMLVGGLGFLGTFVLGLAAVIVGGVSRRDPRDSEALAGARRGGLALLLAVLGVIAMVLLMLSG